MHFFSQGFGRKYCCTQCLNRIQPISTHHCFPVEGCFFALSPARVSGQLRTSSRLFTLAKTHLGAYVFCRVRNSLIDYQAPQRTWKTCTYPKDENLAFFVWVSLASLLPSVQDHSLLGLVFSAKAAAGCLRRRLPQGIKERAKNRNEELHRCLRRRGHAFPCPATGSSAKREEAGRFTTFQSKHCLKNLLVGSACACALSYSLRGFPTPLDILDCRLFIYFFASLF